MSHMFNFNVLKLQLLPSFIWTVTMVTGVILVLLQGERKQHCLPVGLYVELGNTGAHFKKG